MNTNKKTLWMGNLPNWMNFDNLYEFLRKENIFPHKINIKTLSNKKRCAFLEFYSYNDAEAVLNKYNGKIINGVQMQLNWSNSSPTKFNNNYVNKFTVTYFNL